MTAPLGVEDRLAVHDLIMAAAWVNNSANIDGFIALFADDGTVQHRVG